MSEPAKQALAGIAGEPLAGSGFEKRRTPILPRAGSSFLALPHGGIYMSAGCGNRSVCAQHVINERCEESRRTASQPAVAEITIPPASWGRMLPPRRLRARLG